MCEIWRVEGLQEQQTPDCRGGCSETRHKKRDSDSSRRLEWQQHRQLDDVTSPRLPRVPVSAGQQQAGQTAATSSRSGSAVQPSVWWKTSGFCPFRVDPTEELEEVETVDDIKLLQSCYLAHPGCELDLSSPCTAAWRGGPVPAVALQGFYQPPHPSLCVLFQWYITTKFCIKTMLISALLLLLRRLFPVDKLTQKRPMLYKKSESSIQF